MDLYLNLYGPQASNLISNPKSQELQIIHSELKDGASIDSRVYSEAAVSAPRNPQSTQNGTHTLPAGNSLEKLEPTSPIRRLRPLRMTDRWASHPLSDDYLKGIVVTDPESRLHK